MSIGLSDILLFSPSFVPLLCLSPSLLASLIMSILFALRKAKRGIKCTPGCVWERSFGDSRHVGWLQLSRAGENFPEDGRMQPIVRGAW